LIDETDEIDQMNTGRKKQILTPKVGFVKKFKTFEAARRDQWVFKPGPAYFEKVLLMHSSRLLKRIGENFPRGVFRYNNFQEAQEEELNWILMG
jgi:hypothetical protein